MDVWGTPFLGCANSGDDRYSVINENAFDCIDKGDRATQVAIAEN
jgi:hypothetical protein